MEEINARWILGCWNRDGRLRTFRQEIQHGLDVRSLPWSLDRIIVQLGKTTLARFGEHVQIHRG